MSAARVLLAMLALSGCGDLAGGMKGAASVHSDIQAQLGVDSNVHFNTVNGVTSVTVTLARLPADPASTKAKVLAIVKSDMPSASSIVVLTQL